MRVNINNSPTSARQLVLFKKYLHMKAKLDVEVCKMRKIQIEKNVLETVVKQSSTKKEICEKLKIDIHTLNRLLTEYSIEVVKINPRKGGSYPQYAPYVNKEWLVEHWVNTSSSLPELAKQFNLPLSLLESRRHKYSLYKAFKYDVDKDKLFNKDDPNNWYLAGLLVTDGYIQKNRNAFELTLTGESEKRLLQSIKDYYHVGASISEYTPGVYRLRVAVSGLNNYLYTTYNIPNGPKTYSATTPYGFPSEKHARYYVRGCWDGDGFIHKNIKSISLTTASENLVMGLRNIIYQYTGVYTPVHKEKRVGGEYPSIRYSGNKVMLILRWLYQDITEELSMLYLERKYLIFKQADDIV